MEKGMTHLIDLLDKGKGKPTLSISPGDFGNFLKEGMRTEPEKFPQLVKAYQANIQAVFPNWSVEKIISTTLDNIAIFAVIADKGYNSIFLRSAWSHRTPGEWYDHPEEYGKAMLALADYTGTKGPSTRSSIPNLNYNPKKEN